MTVGPVVFWGAEGEGVLQLPFVLPAIIPIAGIAPFTSVAWAEFP